MYKENVETVSDINDESIKRETICKVYQNYRGTTLMVGGNYVFIVFIVSIVFDF